jgi:hypothetical protein
MTRGIAALACAVALVCGSAAPARADDPSSYVSDAFKKVAKRLLEQLASEAIQSACPDKPLCKLTVVHISDAVDAVFSHDDEAIRSALKQLFLDASIAGLLQVTLADHLEAAQLPTLAPAAPWLLRCFAAVASGKPTREPCLPSASELGALRTVAATEGVPAEVTAAFQAVIDRASLGKSIDPIAAMHALAQLINAPPIERLDIAIYLERIASFAEQGLDDGLFAATWAYLHRIDVDTDQQLRNAYGRLLLYPGTKTSPLMFDSPVIAGAAADIAACPLAVRAGIPGFAPDFIAQIWKPARDAFFQQARDAFFNGRAIDWSLLDQLPRYADCGKDAHALVRFARSFAAPLRASEVLSRLAVPALAAAALIDYVRSADEDQLARRTGAILTYAVAGIGAARLNHGAYVADKLTTEVDAHQQVTAIKGYVSTGQALQSCEVAMVLRALKIELPGARPAAKPAAKCFTLVTGTQVAPASLGPDAAVAARRAVVEGAARSSVTDDLPIDTILRALDQLIGGNRRSASRALLRIGIDFVASRVEQLALRMIGGDPAVCQTALEDRWLWQKLGAGCVAHVLISVAYKSVADYFWSEGPNHAGAAEVGRDVYRKLLDSPAIGALPLILNVGLGGTYIYNGGSFWGDHGYGAATVLDKIGLAIYRRVTQRTRFEVGPFAGGFLDAVVRTAANDGVNERYWLLGVTAGWPRLGGLDLGVELHAAAAMPFRFGDTSHYGLAVGAAVVVPFHFILEDK